MERTTNDRHDGNHTRIGRPYTMVVPMNISSHGEAGDLTVEINKQPGKGRTRRLIRETGTARSRPQDNTRQEITTPNARQALADARSRPRDNIRQDDYDT